MLLTSSDTMKIPTITLALMCMLIMTSNASKYGDTGKSEGAPLKVRYILILPSILIQYCGIIILVHILLQKPPTVLMRDLSRAGRKIVLDYVSNMLKQWCTLDDGEESIVRNICIPVLAQTEGI